MKSKLLNALLAGLVLLGACKGRGTREELLQVKQDSALMTQADTVRSDNTEPKLIKTAELRFKVKNVQQTSERLSALTAGFNGMVLKNEITSAAEGTQDIPLKNDSVLRITSLATTADFTVKVPSAKLDSFMNRVAKLGVYVTARKMNVSDKSLEYLAARLKFESRRQLASQQKNGKVVIKNPESILNLKDDMIDQQINNQMIDDQVKNSIVNLSFYESNSICKETIANADPDAYEIPFFKRAVIAVDNGWSIFEKIVLIIIDLWVLILTGVLVWVAIRHYRKRTVFLAKS